MIAEKGEFGGSCALALTRLQNFVSKLQWTLKWQWGKQFWACVVGSEAGRSRINGF